MSAHLKKLSLDVFSLNFLSLDVLHLKLAIDFYSFLWYNKEKSIKNPEKRQKTGVDPQNTPFLRVAGQTIYIIYIICELRAAGYKVWEKIFLDVIHLKLSLDFFNILWYN